MTRSGVNWCVGPDGAPGFSWNPTAGCTPTSLGCRSCWASRLASTRLAHLPGYAGLAKDGTWLGHARFFADRLAEPLRRKKPAGIVVSLMGDLFHDDITFEQIAAVFGVAAACPTHRFYFLTKRAKRQREWFEWLSDKGLRPTETCFSVATETTGRLDVRDFSTWPLPNVWIGVSIEDQATADERIPELLQTPAVVRWLSIEPMLGPVRLDPAVLGCKGHLAETFGNPMIHFVVVGCESGPNARPMQDDWVRSIRDQCQTAGVPLWFKQAMRNGRLDHEPMLDGRTWRQMPVRQP